MADDVWAWCEKTNARGRTVTVKIKWADFQISTRSRSTEMTIQTREKLHRAGPRPDPIGIPTAQRHSTCWRDAFELSSASRARSSGASSFVRHDRRGPICPRPSAGKRPQSASRSRRSRSGPLRKAGCTPRSETGLKVDGDVKAGRELTASMGHHPAEGPHRFVANLFHRKNVDSLTSQVDQLPMPKTSP